MSNPQTRGWGPGWPVNRSHDNLPLAAITGRVHKNIHELVKLLCAETERRGYRIRKGWSWGFASRPIGGTSVPSYHSWCLAVDLNAPTNPHRSPLTTDMPGWMVDLWTSYGFSWGGYWSTPDAMHYEFRGTPADAVAFTRLARHNFGADTEEDDVLQEGDTGNEVHWMQWRINEYLYGDRDADNGIAVDGDFGPETADAVRRLQAHLGFERTGTLNLATGLRLIYQLARA